MTYFDPDPTRTQVWSNGGGTQSGAIAVLIIQGKLPKPDKAVIVDTERENSDTFQYLRDYVRPGLLLVGVEIAVVRKSVYATVDLTSKNGASILIPAYSTVNGKGKLANFCSGEWKREVTNRWLRGQGVKRCDTWMGFSLEEIRRVKPARRKWNRPIYPLIQLGLKRPDCVSLVKDHGWPAPPRSSCWMCPNKSNSEWRDMRDNRPDDFARAIAFEKELRLRDPHLWLHEDCVPLEQADFGRVTEADFVTPCGSGHCFV